MKSKVADVFNNVYQQQSPNLLLGFQYFNRMKLYVVA